MQNSLQEAFAIIMEESRVMDCKHQSISTLTGDWTLIVIGDLSRARRPNRAAKEMTRNLLDLDLTLSLT